MKSIVYVGTSVIALAFVIALYYYLTIGEQSQQTNQLTSISKTAVEQRCNCYDLGFLSGPLFSAPTVKPPMRANDWPLIVQSPYNDLEAEKIYSGVTQPTSKAETMALHTVKDVGRNK